MYFTLLITKYRRQAQNHTAWVLTSLLHFQWQIMRPLLFQTKWSCLLPSMSAASGEASDKMAEFQSGQYKLWHCQLMAEVWSWGDFHRAMSLFFYDAIPDNPSYGYGTVNWWLCSTPRDERNVLWSDWFSLVNCLICYLELAFRICRSKMGLASMFYQHIGKRTSTFALAICVGAIGFERGFDRSEKFLL